MRIQYIFKYYDFISKLFAFVGLLIIFSISSIISFSQSAITYPIGYFRNPMDIPILLSGSYGECRPNHFHTGIDIKTNQVENLPVRAAADGYVSRISISHTGYGNALYITHPNGYQTVYAHLNDFSPAIMQYTKRIQYDKKMWNIDVNVPKDILTVKQSELIAYSGNTGGSVAPHLHFEIRDAATEEVINAALFGFDIKDNIAPIVKSIAIYDADISIYNQSPIIVPLVAINNNEFQPRYKVISVPFRKIRIGVFADDQMNNSENLLGIVNWQLLHNGKSVLSIDNKKLDFKFNRYMNAYGDYKTFKEKGIWFQGLYRLPYNELPIYSGDDGVIDLDQGNNEINISLQDVFKNQSKVNFIIYRNDTSNHKNKPINCQFNSSLKNYIVYENLEFSYDKESVYMPTCIEVKRIGKNKFAPIYSIGHTGIPLHSWSQLSIKVNNVIPFHLRKKMILLHHIKKESLPGAHQQNAMTATYKDGKVSALVRTFGEYEVGIDTVAPVIIFNKQKDKQSISFTVKESLTNIKYCNAYIDNQWICFSRKGDTFTYTFDDKISSAAVHTLKVVVADDNDNIAEKTITFPR